ncbi:unnamed protein product [Danaus chrysippus]|uniref:(African queen) hypothetical protein n=1 Tax=Danaus chrysippus TaxID=151541 RepID=A0A8J2QU88_9NEOP|nr:unnamed protein product [Danaus chrysippus]
MVLTLYGMDASSPVRAVKMVINKLNIPDIEYIQINLLKGEHTYDSFLEMNPQHSIPTIKDGDFIIWDSHAITAYLVSTYGEDDSLNPTEPKQRAIIDQRLHFDSGVLFPALRQNVVPVLFGGQNSFDQKSLDQLSSAYELADKFLTHTWLAGDNLTLADICCYATISTMNVLLPVDVEMYPNLAAWLQRCSEQDFAVNANEKGLALFRDIIYSKLT